MAGSERLSPLLLVVHPAPDEKTGDRQFSSVPDDDREVLRDRTGDGGQGRVGGRSQRVI
jgi:hypothetical protein